MKEGRGEERWDQALVSGCLDFLKHPWRAETNSNCIGGVLFFSFLFLFQKRTGGVNCGLGLEMSLGERGGEERVVISVDWDGWLTSLRDHE